MAKEPPGARDVLNGRRSGRPITEVTSSKQGHQCPHSSFLMA